MLILLLQYLLYSLTFLWIKYHTDGPDAFALIGGCNVHVLDLIVRLRISHCLCTLALLQHPQVIVDTALHDILVLRGVQRFEVDESVAHLSVLRATTSLKSNLDIVHHDYLLALHRASHLSVWWKLCETHCISTLHVSVIHELFVIHFRKRCRQRALLFFAAFLWFELQVVVRLRLLHSRLTRTSRHASLLLSASIEILRFAQTLIAMHLHLLVVGDGRGWSISFPDWDDVVNDHP